ncbi:MAG: sigma 54-interacting transcriptional regulator [Deltaproteobacteria bacterium]|nr:sigma 54-interacting transcriptional regulator [Deltaproteobacteria bacterium]
MPQQARSTTLLELAFALQPGPVSIDQLLEWKLCAPSELWTFVEERLARGTLIRASAPASFVWNDPTRSDEVLASAEDADWAAVLVDPAVTAAALQTARQATAARNIDRARPIYRALLLPSSSRHLPGGEAGCIQLVLESNRWFFHSLPQWGGTEVLARALAAAESTGNVAVQPALVATLGYCHLRAGDAAGAGACFQRAQLAAASLGNPGVLKEVAILVAHCRMLEGRLADAIAAFEESLGDVEQDPPFDPALPKDDIGPDYAFFSQALVYALTGRIGRALDLVHRLRLRAKRTDRPIVESLGRIILASLYCELRDRERTREALEPDLEAWTHNPDPVVAWLTSLPVAWLLQADGRTREAREVLVRAVEARARSQFSYSFGSVFLELLEELDAREGSALAGVTLQGEIDSLLAGVNIHTQGIAHHYAARLLIRTGGDPELIAENFASGAQRLGDAGALVELSRLAEAARSWSERTGRPDVARWQAEERRARQSLPADWSSGDAQRPKPGVPLAALIAELGRLRTLDREETVWRVLAARLCEGLSAERCAIVESGPQGRVLAARGGGDSWLASLRSMLQGRPDRGVEFLEPASDDGRQAGQLLLLPFSPEYAAHGWVCLENRLTRPALGRSDTTLASALAVQIGVIVENIALWRELVSARQRLEQENRYYRDQPEATPVAGELVAHSAPMREVLALIERVAPSDATVLIQGETGVGKELVARELHRCSLRRDGPLITVHIASLSAGLVASALFGHERGAFTGAASQSKGRFELADGGTLFLDEIGELGPEEQVRLLRVLQEGTFERLGGARTLRSDFRLVAATNRDLKAEVDAGRFRQDLYYRLNVFPIRVPPLRERPEEIALLALFFMERYSRRVGKKFEGIGEADVRRLQAYPWPGNVRELEHLVERAVLLSDGPRLKIPPMDRATIPSAATPAAARTEWVTAEEAERRYLREVLEHTCGRLTGKAGATQILGLKPSTLHWRIDQLGLRGFLTQARARRAR